MSVAVANCITQEEMIKGHVHQKPLWSWHTLPHDKAKYEHFYGWLKLRKLCCNKWLPHVCLLQSTKDMIFIGLTLHASYILETVFVPRTYVFHGIILLRKSSASTENAIATNPEIEINDNVRIRFV